MTLLPADKCRATVALWLAPPPHHAVLRTTTRRNPTYDLIVQFNVPAPATLSLRGLALAGLLGWPRRRT